MRALHLLVSEIAEGNHSKKQLSLSFEMFVFCYQTANPRASLRGRLAQRKHYVSLARRIVGPES